MIKNLVLAGAQIKGISYVGCIKALNELRLLNEIENYCGVSSGSIVSLLLFLEIDYVSMVKLIYDIVNYENLRSNDRIKVLDILEYYGVESGDNLIKILEVIINKKTGSKKATFKDLHELYPGKKLIIVGTNLTDNKTEFFSIDSTPDMVVSKAIRISVSVPFIFTKVDYRDNIYIDGGVGCNLPMDFFKDDMEHTLGISIISLSYVTEIDTFEKYINRVFRRLMDNNDNYIIERYSDNMLIITVDYDYMNIDLCEEKKDYLLDSGYRQTYINIKHTIFDPEKEIKKTLNSIINKLEKNII